MSEPAAVRLTQLEKRFGALVAVHPLDLDIPEGSFFSLIGPSGCGKTTTLRMVAGLERPDGGRIEVGGRDITAVPAYRRPVNTVFQSYALFPHLDVAENIAFGLVEERVPRDEIRRRVVSMVELMQLAGRERARPRQLSGGQQQRVALARALVKSPQVLLLDEPLGALDLKLRKELQVELKSVQRRVGTTFVYVTHDQEEAFSMSDRVGVMHEGVLEQVGTPEDVYRRPSSLFVAEFVGSTNRFPGRVADALGPGRYRVELDAGGPLEAAGPAGLEPGAPVVLVVRPEEVLLGGPHGRAARVEDVAYIGPVRHLTLEVAGLGRVLASVHGAGTRLADGEPLTASIPAGAAWLVPERADVAGAAA